MTVINFVWIGEPKFDKGGQDVLGPESFDLNFKKFPQDMPNSIVFWCQACCVERYDAFFKSKGVTIEVKSIEHYLETCQIERENAAFIQQEYTKIILDPARNKIIDRVYFKDMFFNFILATQGNYVLDTNMVADPDRATILPDYPVFMFCILVNPETIQPIDSEVWMQYAPPHDLKRAQACLNTYIHLYQETTEQFAGKYYDTFYHNSVGHIALSALYLKEKLWTQQFIPSPDASFGIWRAFFTPTGAKLMDLLVTKEYYNTHRQNRDNKYSPSHLHVYHLLFDNIKFDLDHGISR